MLISLYLDEGTVTGVDSCILAAPDWLLDEQAPLQVQRLRAYIHNLTKHAGEIVHEKVHHADWLMTDDPEMVQTKGMAHDCTSCRAGVDQALAYLRDNPAAKLLVGTLYYCD